MQKCHDAGGQPVIWKHEEGKTSINVAEVHFPSLLQHKTETKVNINMLLRMFPEMVGRFPALPGFTDAQLDLWKQQGYAEEHLPPAQVKVSRSRIPDGAKPGSLMHAIPYKVRRGSRRDEELEDGKECRREGIDDEGGRERSKSGGEGTEREARRGRGRKLTRSSPSTQTLVDELPVAYIFKAPPDCRSGVELMLHIPRLLLASHRPGGFFIQHQHLVRLQLVGTRARRSVVEEEERRLLEGWDQETGEERGERGTEGGEEVRELAEMEEMRKRRLNGRGAHLDWGRKGEQKLILFRSRPR
eukprot:753769-Hanusia_phi.AAC.2